MNHKNANDYLSRLSYSRLFLTDYYHILQRREVVLRAKIIRYLQSQNNETSIIELETQFVQRINCYDCTCNIYCIWIVFGIVQKSKCFITINVQTYCKLSYRFLFRF